MVKYGKILSPNSKKLSVGKGGGRVRIPAVNPYGTYSAIYGGPVRPVDAVNAASPGLRQLDDVFNNIKLLSNYTRAQAAAQRDAYRVQIKEFSVGAKSLAGSTAAASSLPVQADATKTAAAVHKFVGDFNRLTTSLRQADNLTAKGRGLTSSLQAAAAVREKDLAAIGIAYDRDSGELTVDELKLKQAVSLDYQRVKDTLGGTAGFGKAVEAAVRPALDAPVGDLFSPPAPAPAVGYPRRQGAAGALAAQAAYGRGLLLDLMA